MQEDGLSGEEFEITAPTERQYSIWRQTEIEKKGKKANWSLFILLMAATEDKRGYLVEADAVCWVMHSCFWHPNCRLVTALISLDLSTWGFFHQHSATSKKTLIILSTTFLHDWERYASQISHCAKMLSGPDCALKWNPCLPDHECIMNNRPFVW